MRVKQIKDEIIDLYQLYQLSPGNLRNLSFNSFATILITISFCLVNSLDLELSIQVSCFHKTIDHWYSALDNSELVGVVFIDLKKAFYNVDHSIICNKLRHYGVLGNEFPWFKSYISNRKQFCRVNGVDSKHMSATRLFSWVTSISRLHKRYFTSCKP